MARNGGLLLLLTISLAQSCSTCSAAFAWNAQMQCNNTAEAASFAQQSALDSCLTCFVLVLVFISGLCWFHWSFADTNRFGKALGNRVLCLKVWHTVRQEASWCLHPCCSALLYVTLWQKWLSKPCQSATVAWSCGLLLLLAISSADSAADISCWVVLGRLMQCNATAGG